jgi:dihydroxyacetone kinase-like protein
MDQARVRAIIEAAAGAVIDHAEELTELDRAIGDGDHGLNLRRGCEAVLAQLEALSARPLPAALEAAGTTLILKVGGASGPLYGTLLRTLGKELPAEPGPAETARALGLAVEAVKRLGKSDRGQKTMLDVLCPVQEELLRQGPDLLPRLRRRAEEAAQATVPLRATRGRASFLGERSIGHLDPGARSSALLVEAVCLALER